MKNNVIEYPRVTINYEKLYHNINVVKNECEKKNIEIAGVVKGFNGSVKGVKQFVKANCKHIATSRLIQIKELKEAGVDANYMLVRIPMLSEVDALVKYVDCSLNSEKKVIEAINKSCEKQEKNHGIVIMADLGDLREGIWDKEELIKLAVYVENNLKNIDLLGIGTNLGCYGSIKPTRSKLQELCDIAIKIENKIGRELEIVSGGATSSYPLVLENDIPEKINHLRIGEGIILSYDLPEIWQFEMDDLYQDIFKFEAEIIEIKNKPTHPVGEIFIDGFGRKPEYEDRGFRKRAIIGAGKLDFALNDKIFPQLKGVEVIGSSSDHTILDVEDCENNLEVGDIIAFNLSYPSLMYLTNSRYINVNNINEKKEDL